MKRFSYHINCVEARSGEVINDMVDAAREITFRTFAKHCDYYSLATSLGYDKHLRIQNDYAVRFYKSKYLGQPCYFIVQSAIEWIFLKGNSHGRDSSQDLHPRHLSGRNAF